jgi:hypothetical protein
MTVETTAEGVIAAEAVDGAIERDRDARAASGTARGQRRAHRANRKQRNDAARALMLAALVLLAGCGDSGSSSRGAEPAASGVRWLQFRHFHDVVDLTGPRRDGRLTATTSRRLFLLSRGGAVRRFARGPGGYRAAPGAEPYIALSPARFAGGGCSFGVDAVYALGLGSHPEVVRIDRRGRARRFTRLPGGETPKGIAFDEVGRFGHRLLVTGTLGGAADGRSVIFVVDCRGRVRTLTRTAPRHEGGIAVAPRSFGRYAGLLIAADENSGHVIAIDARGAARTIADSGLPTGGDVGIESAGFVPTGLGRAGMAYLADRGVPGNKHPGTDSVLGLGATALSRAGVAPGDLLIASEGGASTISVRCGTTCTVRHVADGPAVTHAEGHIVFAP